MFTQLTLYLGRVVVVQLNFIYKGFVRLLNNAHQSVSSYLPYSVPRINAEQELLILLWKVRPFIHRFILTI